jgi:hypothetical protein
MKELGKSESGWTVSISGIQFCSLAPLNLTEINLTHSITGVELTALNVVIATLEQKANDKRITLEEYLADLYC